MGEMGHFSIFALISFLCSAVVLLQVSTVIVDTLAEHVLPDREAFQRVKHGHIKASLKEISAAIKYKRENTMQGDHDKSSTCISPVERVDPRISKQETVLELAPSLRQIRDHGDGDK